MKAGDLAIWLICAIGGLLLGSGLGIYLGYQPFALITDLGLSGVQQLKVGTLMSMLGLMAHVILGGSLIPRSNNGS